MTPRWPWIPLALILLGPAACVSRRVDTIVLVTIDTWRADAAGFQGSQDPSPTPRLDRLASRGRVFANAWTPVPLTGPSHWSILSGRWPFRDGVRKNGNPVPQGGPEPVPSMLRRDGWLTAGFVSCAVLSHRFGYHRGFDHFDDSVPIEGSVKLETMPERPANETVERALAFAGTVGARRRLFLWVHLFDPHFPYRLHTQRAAGSPREAYLDEVSFADSQAGRLADGLIRLGRRSERTLWIVLADHGEGLGDHMERTHGYLLHGATTRIPLMVAGPDVVPGRTKSPAATVDVAPTICAAAGVSYSAMDGRNLFGPGSGKPRFIPMESVTARRDFGLSMVIGGTDGAWLWERSPRDHLWNLDEDPEEGADVAALRPDVVRRFATLRRRHAAKENRRNSLSSRTAKELRSLGYLSGGAPAGEGDAREFVATGAQKHYRIMTLQAAGRFREAESLVMEFLADYPRSPSIWIEAGFIALQGGERRVAAERFERALSLDPENGQAQVNLANIAMLDGDNDRAKRLYGAVLAADPDDPFALYNMGLILSSEGDAESANRHWRRFLRLYPNHRLTPSLRARVLDPG